MRSARISDELQQVLEPLLLMVDGLQLQLARVEQRLDELSAQAPVVAQLTTIPGVGRIVAASFVSVIDDARRFRHSHQVESYLGLVPSEDSSGGKVRLGGISKRGNSYLRALLVQAAWVILRLPTCGDPLQMWGRDVVKRRGNRIGVIAVAGAGLDGAGPTTRAVDAKGHASGRVVVARRDRSLLPRRGDG